MHRGPLDPVPKHLGMLKDSWTSTLQGNPGPSLALLSELGVSQLSSRWVKGSLEHVQRIFSFLPASVFLGFKKRGKSLEMRTSLRPLERPDHLPLLPTRTARSQRRAAHLSRQDLFPLDQAWEGGRGPGDPCSGLPASF